MTNLEKRIKIAESCGYIPCAKSFMMNGNWHSAANDLPDYFGDLNICHKMEKCLTWEEGSAFNELLYFKVPHDEHIYHASSELREETFGKIRKLW